VIVSDLTPFQTIGPYFAILPLEGEAAAATEKAAGRAIVIAGTVRDGLGAIVPDALIESWQADPNGRFDTCDETFRGFARAPTDASGNFEIRTVMPGPIAEGHAPHVLLSVLARGVLTRLVTRVYFPGEKANVVDPILALVPGPRRATLIAELASENRYRFDVVLQGPGETVFFDV
jgi:protocatechuate 3,4-dioxygenase alpha subunit